MRQIFGDEERRSESAIRNAALNPSTKAMPRHCTTKTFRLQSELCTATATGFPDSWHCICITEETGSITLGTKGKRAPAIRTEDVMGGRKIKRQER